jgi:hypothetical protein
LDVTEPLKKILTGMNPAASLARTNRWELIAMSGSEFIRGAVSLCGLLLFCALAIAGAFPQ